jgi:hypothetical protein
MLFFSRKDRHCLGTRFRYVKVVAVGSTAAKSAAILLLISLLVIAFSAIVLLYQPQTAKKLDVFVGIDIGFGGVEDATKIIDAVSDYVNLVVVGSLNVTADTDRLTSICDYLYKKGLYFIVYVGFGHESNMPPEGPDKQFFVMAESRWEGHLLGAYLFDEPGGKQLDSTNMLIKVADNYSDAAIAYTHHLNYFIGNSTAYYSPVNITLYTSDYALYWYDYLSGYDVVFGEFVENQSRQIPMGLCRGAAKSLQKNWGIIITYSHQQPPYIEPAPQLYQDMVTAYENGARYILVFDSPGNNTPTTDYGILEKPHLDSMRKFWEYIGSAPTVAEYPADVAFVLPKDYGYGLRGPNDTIWGLWKADALSSTIWDDANKLIAEYGQGLDIVYETEIADVPIELPYKRLIFWNATVIEK